MLIARRHLPLALALLVACCAKLAQPPARLPLALPAPPVTLPAPRTTLPAPRVGRRPPTPARAARSTPRIDVAGAARARAVGLAALSRGDTAAARALLRRAATLDPGNPLIQRDLARAGNAAPRPR